MTTDVDPRVLRRLADMHAVYRMFGRSGELLYIGKTGHLHRFDEHAIKRWFPLVHRIVLEWHDTEASAAVSERHAIQAENPRYNIAGTTKRKRRVSAVPPPTIPKPVVAANVLADVLRVFGDSAALHWQAVADRLAHHFPGRWADVTKDAASAQCRALGVPSVSVRAGALTAKGCRRADVEAAAARRLLAS